MNEEMYGFDSMIECYDWRYSAAIVGMIKYFNYHNEDYDAISYRIEKDKLFYNKSDLEKERYLYFVEEYYSDSMEHCKIESILENESYSEEQIRLINDCIKARSYLKKLFGKVIFDGTNKDQILGIINNNRMTIIEELFRTRQYGYYLNNSSIFENDKSRCKLLGYYVDEGKKGKGSCYYFDKETFVGENHLEFDFIPFAFSELYDSCFINNNCNIKKLMSTNEQLHDSLINREDLTKTIKGALFKQIITSTNFIDYDVEVIVKSRSNDYFESLFIRKNAIDILKHQNFKFEAFARSLKITDNYYRNIQVEVLDAILNNLYLDSLIEIYLKQNNSFMVKNLVDVNLLIKGANSMNEKMKSAYACACEVQAKLPENKLKTYKTKLISAIVAEDYDRACDILLQLSSYSGVYFAFAYQLFEDFEKNKDLAYTFINGLMKNNISNDKNETIA